MSNSLTITGSPVTAETTTADYCTISGFLRDIGGAALGGYSIRIRYIYNPFAFGEDTLFLKEYQTIIADSTGKVSFKLVQGGKVKVEIPGRTMDCIKIRSVPTESTLTLIGFLFPYVKSFTFSDTAETIAVGGQYAPEGTITLTDGSTSTNMSGATFASSDTSKVSVDGSNVKGVAAGTSTITMASYDVSKLEATNDSYGDSIKRLSVPTITNTNNLTVTVG